MKRKPGRISVLPGWIFVKICAMLATVKKCFLRYAGLSAVRGGIYIYGGYEIKIFEFRNSCKNRPLFL
jgi:hypothetical protein